MKFSFSLSWLLLVVATPSVGTKKKKKLESTKNKNTSPIIDGYEPDLNCDPMSDPMIRSDGCKTLDCTSDRWKDG